MHYITQFGFWTLSLITKIIPINWMIAIVYRLLSLVKYRKQVINKNFNNTTAHQIYKGSKEQFYKDNIRNVARVMVESLYSESVDIDEVTYWGVADLEARCRETNGVLLLASHYGNWELACAHLPIHTDVPCYGVYKPLKNKAADESVLQRRSQHGLQLVPMKQIGRVILEHKRDKIAAIYILISDQNPNSKNSIIWADFMGIKSAFFNGPDKLMQRYGFHVSYMRTEVGDELNRYEIRFDDLDGQNVTQSYANHLQSQLEKDPTKWLWSHKRWKRNF